MEFAKLEHIGIAVEDLNKSIKLFELLSGSKCYKVEEVQTEKVKTAFFNVNNTKLELLEATDDSSVIKGFLEKKGEGVHHLAFEVKDINETMTFLSSNGFRLLNETPKIGADNKLICFMHPKDTNGVLIEICQEITENRTE